jgi:hypothetical protein
LFDGLSSSPLALLKFLPLDRASHRARLLLQPVTGLGHLMPASPIQRSRREIANLGGTVLTGSPADFVKLISAETKKWGKVILVGQHQAGSTCWHRLATATGTRRAGTCHLHRVGRQAQMTD